tara:strand:+ start:367 stop:1257 length:891 start_codon:yes stop_codon:yes gene_type:complete
MQSLVKMSELNTNSKEQSTVTVLVHSFFVIPFIIAVFGLIFFFMIQVLIKESSSAEEYLNQVKVGSSTKRWQSAFELGKILSNPKLIPDGETFKKEMILTYKNSINDNPLVRTYLALGMGRTGDQYYGKTLMDGIKDTDPNSRSAAINALGMIQYKPAIDEIKKILKDTNSSEDRLTAVIALGMIGDKSAISDLKKLLLDEEPNIRWDASIALAKLGDDSGMNEILNLLERSYFDNYKNVDDWEVVQAMMIAIKMTEKLIDDKFVPKLKYIAINDPNMKIRDSALKILKNTYNITF